MAGNHQLLLRYGLGTQPTDAQADRWARRVRELISNGRDRESAGAIAAREIFPDFGTRIYASEADSIETLLRLVEDKK